MCIADDTKWLFFRIVPPPSAGEQYTTKLGFYCFVKYSFDNYSEKSALRQLGAVSAIIFSAVFRPSTAALIIPPA